MINEFIDKVFVINLDSRKDRLSFMDYQLNRQEIEYERFPAISYEIGLIGLILTMKKVFKQCLESEGNRWLILEDDAEFLLPNVKSYISQAFKELPEDFYCFHLGLNLLSQPERISQNILRIDQAFSSHAIIYSRQGVEFILPLLDQFPDIPYDITLRRNVQITKRCYATFPMICTQKDGYSDIEDKVTQWRNIMATTYAMHTKNLQSYPGQTGEIIKCYNGHMIDGMIPPIDHLKFEVQHPELIGKVCDCKKVSYWEEECGCTVKQWEVKWKENIS